MLDVVPVKFGASCNTAKVNDCCRDAAFDLSAELFSVDAICS